MKEEIATIQSHGFTNVKWYDNDLDYVYYDALMNDTKVEVRIAEDVIEWRYLGVNLEDIEWFSLKPIVEVEEETEELILLDPEIVEVNENKKPDPMKINIFVNLNINQDQEEKIVVNS